VDAKIVGFGRDESQRGFEFRLGQPTDSRNAAPLLVLARTPLLNCTATVFTPSTTRKSGSKPLPLTVMS